MSVFRVFLVPIFPHSDGMRKDYKFFNTKVASLVYHQNRDSEALAFVNCIYDCLEDL